MTLSCSERNSIRIQNIPPSEQLQSLMTTYVIHTSPFSHPAKDALEPEGGGDEEGEEEEEHWGLEVPF